MNPFSIYKTQRTLQKSQWLDHTAIKELQEIKLKQLISYAYDHVPYYQSLLKDSGLKPDDFQTISDLQNIPVTTKAELQAIPVNERISNCFSKDELITEHSSGSTGQPFTTYFDKQFVTTRNNMFLRALRAMGYRPGQKMMLITSGHNRTKRIIRWYYTSIESSAEELITQLNSIKPTILYGCTTPLRLMALHARKTGCMLYQPKIVISTAETLDQSTRSILKDVFNAKVYDLYGLTEMGLVAWQCPAQNGYHLSEDTTIVEFEKDNESQADKLIMTNLELKSMPLIRYQTGDLAKVMNERNCECGRTLKRIERIEGRMIDCIRLSDNSVISPYRITLALENLAGLGRYQVLQNAIDKFTVRIEKNNFDQTAMRLNIQNALLPVLGPKAQFTTELQNTLTPPTGKKFRIIESLINKN